MAEWQGTDISKAKTIVKKILYFKKKKPTEDRSLNTYDFYEKASKIAPIYASSGNHEWYYISTDIEVMDKYNIRLLDNEYIILNHNGKELLLGGLPTRYDEKWLREYADREGYKILLMHHPEYYERVIKDKCDKFNLILSGHAHGGQWNIFGHAVVAPGQGINPKYYHGLYQTDAGVLEVSSGTSNTVNAPRINNPCEVVIINI